MFTKNGGGTWIETKKLVANDLDTDDQFGNSVSIDGNYLAIGAPNEDHDTSNANFLSNSGSAYLFSKDNFGIWNQQQKIVSLDRTSDDEFGFSVSLSGSKTLVGAYKEDEDSLGGNSLSSAGSAYLFELQTSGNWNQLSKLVASDRESTDFFASSVSIDDKNFIFNR